MRGMGKEKGNKQNRNASESIWEEDIKIIVRGSTLK
jgi:ribosomal protein L19E